MPAAMALEPAHAQILAQTERHVADQLGDDATGHDIWHVLRVRDSARRIAEVEGGDRYVIELAALLHDIADWKFHGGDDSVGPERARAFLTDLGVDEPTVAQVAQIIFEMPFRGAGVANPISTLEGRIVQDADRLDAIGAIGIARTFAYGGAKGQPMHAPGAEPERHGTFDDYRKGGRSTINHFHEKLLLLKDRMNTGEGRRLAEVRHQRMITFLEDFHGEWGQAAFLHAR